MERGKKGGRKEYERERGEEGVGEGERRGRGLQGT